MVCRNTIVYFNLISTKNKGYHTVATGKIYHNTLPDSMSWSETKLHIDGYPFDPDAVYRGEESKEIIENKKKKIRHEKDN